MAITEHVKRSAVNVTTGEVEREYYEDTEWAALTAAKAAAALPNARATRKEAHKAEARALVTDNLGDEFTRMKQLTAYARLSSMPSLDAEEAAVLNGLRARVNWATAIEAEYERVKALIDGAGTLAELEAVEAPSYPTL